MNIYSEGGEDQVVAENFKLPEKGFYLDVGCGKPLDWSNTQFLRDRGWSGICIDANESFTDLWKDVPNCTFISGVVSDKSEARFITDREWINWRISDDGVRVKTIQLGDILKQYNAPEIDLMSVDIEGHELQAMQTMDFGIYKPKIIICEYSTMGVPCYKAHNWLKENGYADRFQVRSNFIYERTI